MYKQSIFTVIEPVGSLTRHKQSPGACTHHHHTHTQNKTRGDSSREWNGRERGAAKSRVTIKIHRAKYTVSKTVSESECSTCTVAGSDAAASSGARSGARRQNKRQTARASGMVASVELQGHV